MSLLIEAAEERGVHPETLEGKILVVGPGHNDDQLALLAKRFPRMKIIGVEWDKMAMESTRRQLSQSGLDSRIELRWADARNLRDILPDASIQLVVIMGVLDLYHSKDSHTVSSLRSILTEAVRVLDQDGVLVAGFGFDDTSSKILAELGLRNLRPEMTDMQLLFKKEGARLASGDEKQKPAEEDAELRRRVEALYELPRFEGISHVASGTQQNINALLNYFRKAHPKFTFWTPEEIKIYFENVLPSEEKYFSEKVGLPLEDVRFSRVTVSTRNSISYNSKKDGFDFGLGHVGYGVKETRHSVVLAIFEELTHRLSKIGKPEGIPDEKKEHYIAEGLPGHRYFAMPHYAELAEADRAELIEVANEYAGWGSRFYEEVLVNKLQMLVYREPFIQVIRDIHRDRLVFYQRLLTEEDFGSDSWPEGFFKELIMDLAYMAQTAEAIGDADDQRQFTGIAETFIKKFVGKYGETTIDPGAFSRLFKAYRRVYALVEFKDGYGDKQAVKSATHAPVAARLAKGTALDERMREIREKIDYGMTPDGDTPGEPGARLATSLQFTEEARLDGMNGAQLAEGAELETRDYRQFSIKVHDALPFATGTMIVGSTSLKFQIVSDGTLIVDILGQERLVITKDEFRLSQNEENVEIKNKKADLLDFKLRLAEESFRVEQALGEQSPEFLQLNVVCHIDISGLNLSDDGVSTWFVETLKDVHTKPEGKNTVFVLRGNPSQAEELISGARLASPFIFKSKDELPEAFRHESARHVSIVTITEEMTTLSFSKELRMLIKPLTRKNMHNLGAILKTAFFEARIMKAGMKIGEVSETLFSRFLGAYEILLKKDISNRTQFFDVVTSNTQERSLLQKFIIEPHPIPVGLFLRAYQMGARMASQSA